MSDFVTMQVAIVEDTLRDDIPINTIKRAIRSAITQWEVRRWLFNQKRRRILTVANQEFYSLAAPVLLSETGAALSTGEKVIELDRITITMSGNQPYKLTSRTQEWFEQFQSPQTGDPTDYGFYGDELRLWPVPSSVRTMDMQAHVRLGPSPLINDTDTNAWMTDAESLIREQAKLILYRDTIKDTEGASEAALAVTEAEWALTKLATAKGYTGKVKAWAT